MGSEGPRHRSLPEDTPFKHMYDAQEKVLEERRRRYVPVKPLVAGIFLLILAIFGLLFGAALLFLPTIFAVPTFITALLVLSLRKHKWALLGGITGVVLGLNMRLLSPVFLIMGIVSLILIFMSEDEFED